MKELSQSPIMKTPKLPKLLSLLLLSGLIAARPPTAQAQTSITAAPDGTGTIINYNGNTYNINGGTQAGANLFHSFQEFGLNPQEIANFLSNPDILNIVGRVTGGNPSIIQGLIQLTGGNSNLFLMNPSGWVFTQGASLDVPGSFGATTATRIGFGDAYFNAYGNNNYSTLIGNPTSLIFDQNNPSWIVNEANLAVKPGESLWMVGGGIISTGTVETEGGNITLAAIPGKNQVRLSHEGMVVNLVLDAAPVEGSVNIPGNLMGIRAVDIPRYITGGSEIGHANEVIIEADGTVRLIRNDTAINEGDTVIAGEVTAENINLMAAGVVTPTNSSLIQGDTTVVRFPEAGGTNILSVIDSRADNAEDLLYGAAAGTISSIIGREEEGIAAISEKLEEVDTELDGIAITAEGNEGNFWLGKTWVTNENINNYAGQLATWAKSLDEGADILLYSCFTALGEAGQALIGDLAHLTGADVAASTNATGSANYGGDWVLESSTGSIEVGNPFEAETLSGWDGKLATLTVTNLNNTGAGSLRQRIQTDAAAGDMITFGVSGTITLAGTASGTDGEITWGQNNLTLDGGSKIVVDGGGNSRVFNTSAANVTIQNITIQNGSFAGNGGGIHSTGAVTLNNSTVSGNSAATAAGGGIRSAGAVTLNNSTVSGNSAATAGGVDADTITLTNSTVSGNSASNTGGLNANNITLTNSTVSGNSAGLTRGGLNAINTITLTNSTVSGNSAGQANGGLFAGSNITLT
ncbi:DUF4347 domain-containing protein, partial [Spirulina sp. 06S082]|uniref:DUF4347 domain-containing protein n=1 Tax=Spirulina sp. 06S082 TaxID=3110248 RepID=UPI002B1F5DD5